MDSHFGDGWRRWRWLTRFGGSSTPPIVRRLSSRRWRALLEPFGNDHLIRSFLKLIYSSGDTIHHSIHAFAVIRQILGETGNLRIKAKTDEVQNQKSDAANDEACDGA